MSPDDHSSEKDEAIQPAAPGAPFPMRADRGLWPCRQLLFTELASGGILEGGKSRTARRVWSDAEAGAKGEACVLFGLLDPASAQGEQKERIISDNLNESSKTRMNMQRLASWFKRGERAFSRHTHMSHARAFRFSLTRRRQAQSKRLRRESENRGFTNPNIRTFADNEKDD